MEITLDRQYLQSKVDLLKGITKHKTLLTICRSVLFDFDGGKDGKILATDLEVSAITGLGQFTQDSGENNTVRIAVPAGTLSEILENLGDQEVTIDCGEDKVLRIVSGRTEIGLALMNPEEFPDVEVLNETEVFQVPAKDILRGIGKVLYAVSMDDKRYILTGVLMQVKGGEFRMCATDGFRMALLKKEMPDISDSPQIVIPGRNIRLLKEILDENAVVGVIITDARVQFMTSQVTVIFRTLQDKYPDYESILAATGNHSIAFIKRMPFLQCLNRMAPLGTKTDPVSLVRTSPGALSVRMESEKGYAQEMIDCEFKNSTPFKFNFNLKQLLDAVEHIDADQLVVRYPDAYGVVVFDSMDYICGVMPIRTAGWETPIEQQIPGDRDE